MPPLHTLYLTLHKNCEYIFDRSDKQNNNTIDIVLNIKYFKNNFGS